MIVGAGDDSPAGAIGVTGTVVSGRSRASEEHAGRVNAPMFQAELERTGAVNRAPSVMAEDRVAPMMTKEKR
ncbi:MULTISPECIES: hypothetical protein [unclassified Gordonia (in: high G+C Gram-positive bacteria)]|uniref:hypothetical protein n=1 Tax=unclassified Gordonia (in: high G+C Gram-positive bacteria) TaxID=2657482 RepID=UPI001F0F6208|nr:hypothetical protein [Gordonia sp. ABSL49_1]MCH5642671.1 hypothetical protein [Gordonia sp. ABSL49_1]